MNINASSHECSFYATKLATVSFKRTRNHRISYSYQMLERKRFKTPRQLQR